MINPGILDLRQPSNLAFHNLSDSELPTGTQRLLELSLNLFFLQQGRPTPTIEDTIRKMQRSIIIQHWISKLQISKKTDNNYTPGLYLPSDWTPPLATPSVECRLLHFENKLQKKVTRRKPCMSSNLDFFQKRALESFTIEPTSISATSTRIWAKWSEQNENTRKECSKITWIPKHTNNLPKTRPTPSTRKPEV
jgi:hypothetical protein